MGNIGTAFDEKFGSGGQQQTAAPIQVQPSRLGVAFDKEFGATEIPIKIPSLMQRARAPVVDGDAATVEYGTGGVDLAESAVKKKPPPKAPVGGVGVGPMWDDPKDKRTFWERHGIDRSVDDSTVLGKVINDIQAIGQASKQYIMEGKPYPGEITDRLKNMATRAVSPLAYIIPGVTRKDLVAEMDEEAENFTGFGEAVVPAMGKVAEKAGEWIAFQRVFGVVSKGTGAIGETKRAVKIKEAIEKMGGVKQFAGKFPRIYQATKAAFGAGGKGFVVGATYGGLEGLEEGDVLKRMAVRGGTLAAVAAGFSAVSSIDNTLYVNRMRGALVKNTTSRYNAKIKALGDGDYYKGMATPQAKALIKQEKLELQQIDEIVSAAESQLIKMKSGKLAKGAFEAVESPQKAAERLIKYGYKPGKGFKGVEELKIGLGKPPPKKSLLPTTRRGEVAESVKGAVKAVKSPAKTISAAAREQLVKSPPKAVPAPPVAKVGQKGIIVPPKAKEVAENDYVVFEGAQEGLPEEGVPDVKLFTLKQDIPDHPKGSTVSENTLRKAGIPLPGEAIAKETVTEAKEVQVKPPEVQVPSKAEVTKGKQPWEMTKSDYMVVFSGINRGAAKKEIKDEILTKLSKAKEDYDVAVKSGKPRITARAKRFLDSTEKQAEMIMKGEVPPAYMWGDRAYMKTILSHKKVLKQALSENKPVPLKVLEEYAGEKWADDAMAKAQPAEGKAKDIAEKFTKEGNKVIVFEDEKVIRLDTIIVPKENRKQGVGSKIVQELVDFADSVGKRIDVSPATKEFEGTTSKGRLVKFYRRFGFVENKGRNKDLRISATLFREPQAPPAEVTEGKVESRETASELIIEGVGRGKIKGDTTKQVKRQIIKAISEGKTVRASKAEGGRNYWNSILGFKTDGIDSILTPEQFKKIQSGEIKVNGWPEFMADQEYAKLFDKFRVAEAKPVTEGKKEGKIISRRGGRRPLKELGGMPEKPPGLTKAEAEHLGRREAGALRAGQKRGRPIGYKMGQREAEDKLNSFKFRVKQKDVNFKQIRDEIFDLVKKALPTYERGKAKVMSLLKSISPEKTDKTNRKNLMRAIAMTNKYAEEANQRALRAQIHKELKRTKPKKKGGLLKGKFTADIQRKLDEIRLRIKYDREQARSQIADNIAKYENGTLPYEDMRSANEQLAMRGIKGMTSAELQNVLNNIISLKETGKSIREVKKEIEDARIKQIRNKAVKILTGGKGIKKGAVSVPRGELEVRKTAIERIANWQYGWDSYLDKLSKFDISSQMYQSDLSKFGASIHVAHSKEMAGTDEQINKLFGKFQEIFDVKTTNQINATLNNLKQEVDLGTFRNADSEEIHLKLNKEQLIKKYQELQDPTLEATFRGGVSEEGKIWGMRWTDEIIEAINNSLSSQEKAWADYHLQFYQDYYPSVNEVYREIYGVDLPHNLYYSPIGRDIEADIPENVLLAKESAHYASTVNGSLKSRTATKLPLRFTNADAVLVNHIIRMEHFKAWSGAMRDMRRLFGNKKIRTAIRQYHGKNILQQIDVLLNQMARGGIEKAKINRGVDYLRRNFTLAILGLKPVIGLKQIPSVLAYITEMPLADFVGGVADFWGNPLKNYRFMRDNSTYFRTRWKAGFERDIKFAMKKGYAKTLAGKGNVRDWFMAFIRAGDKFATMQGGWAKYKSALKENEQAGAMIAAEQSTKRTQPSFSLESLSPLQRGGSWMKLFTMFQNQPNKYFRIIADNARNMKFGRQTKAKGVANILLAWIILPMLFQFIADAFQFKKKHQLRAAILGPINHLLVIGQLAQSIYGWMTKEPFDYQASPVFSTGRDLQIAVTKTAKLVRDGKDPYKEITMDDLVKTVEYYGRAVGKVTGVPTPWAIQAERAGRKAIAPKPEDVITELKEITKSYDQTSKYPNSPEKWRPISENYKEQVEELRKQLKNSQKIGKGRLGWRKHPTAEFIFSPWALEAENYLKTLTNKELRAAINKDTYNRRYKRDDKWYPRGHAHKGKEATVARLRKELELRESKK